MVCPWEDTFIQQATDNTVSQCGEDDQAVCASSAELGQPGWSYSLDCEDPGAVCVQFADCPGIGADLFDDAAATGELTLDE
jgi:hypothetical protein